MDNTQASGPVETGGNLRAPPSSALEQVPPAAPTEVIESHPPALPPAPQLRIWNSGGQTAENRARGQEPVDNVTAENQPGARPTRASTQAVDNGAVLINWEEAVRRTLFRVSRGNWTRLPNEMFSMPTLALFSA